MPIVPVLCMYYAYYACTMSTMPLYNYRLVNPSEFSLFPIAKIVANYSLQFSEIFPMS